jgi:hypothetical protein
MNYFHGSEKAGFWKKVQASGPRVGFWGWKDRAAMRAVMNSATSDKAHGAKWRTK